MFTSISVRDFMSLCCEPSLQVVKLWNLDNNECIFSGVLKNMLPEYQNLMVQSWDYITSDDITLNVSLEDVSLEGN